MNEEKLSCLLYVSTAVREFSPGELDDILEVSRKQNEANGISGLLVYCREHFIQVLEGAENIVTETFDRISGDNRHKNVTVMLREPLEERFFNDWSMAFRRFPDSVSLTNPALESVLSHKGPGTIQMVKKLFQVFQKGLAGPTDK